MTPARQCHGVFSATVHNNTDPLGRNRVQLKIPQVLGNAISQWAVPLALVSPSPVPAVGAPVHAMFLGGDPAHPVYSMQTQTPTLFASYDAQVAEDSPAAWWRLDEGTGATVVLDDTGNGFNGTATAVTFQQPQAVDSVPSAGFNGTSSRVVTTYTAPAFTAFSAEVWVNLNGVTPSGTTDQILGGGNTGNSGAADQFDSFNIFLNDTTLAPMVNIGNGTASKSFSLGPALPATGWTHLAVTWDGTTVTCYRNGATASTTPFAGPMAAGTNPVAIGASLGASPGNWYSGLISEAAIYATALTSARVLAHYKAQTGAITSANIATGSITSNQIAAGTIIAGVVDGTTITGAEIVADAVDGGSFLAYSGTPANGNLFFSLAAAQFTDSNSNIVPVGMQIGTASQNQIYANPNANQAFTIQPPNIAGTLEAVFELSTPDTNQAQPGTLGSLLLNPANIGTAAKQSTVLTSPYATTGAALILEAQNDGGTDAPLVTVGSVSTQGGAMVFSPSATFLDYASLFYASAAQTVVKTFTSSTTWTAPAGVTQVKVEVLAPGGGGATAASSGGPFPSPGGGGGEYAAENSNTCVPGNVYTITVGTGGTGGTPGSPNGGNGGNSSFSGTGATTVTAHGGTGAVHASVPGPNEGTPGAGGTGSGNSVHHPGGAGGAGSFTSDAGSGGGSSAGSSSAGNAGGVPSKQTGAAGGTAPAGGGAGGKGGNSGSSGNAGANGQAPGGGGGGGGYNSSTGTGGNAGAGANGMVRLTYTTGAPGLLASLAAVSGTDQFGASYPAGFNLSLGLSGGKVMQVQNTTASPSAATLLVETAAAGDFAYGVQVTGQSFASWKNDSNGQQYWGPGTATQDTHLYRSAAGQLATEQLVASVSGAAETWHSLGTLSGTGAGGATINMARYRMMPDATVLIEVDISFASSTTSGTPGSITFSTTLPSAYQPSSSGTDIRCACAQTNASGQLSRIFVGAAGGSNPGVVQLAGFSAATWIGTYSAQVRYSVI